MGIAGTGADADDVVDGSGVPCGDLEVVVSSRRKVWRESRLARLYGEGFGYILMWNSTYLLQMIFLIELEISGK